MRTLMRWQPTRDLTIVHRQLDQLLDDIAHIKLDSPFIKPQELSTVWIPAIELQDQGAALLLRIELPGVEAKDVDLQVTRDAVSISGDYQAEARDQGNLRSEFRYGKFRRVIPLRTEVQLDQVQAEFKHGILTLNLPKAEAAKVVKIDLTSTESAAAATDAATEATDDLWNPNSAEV